MFLITKDVAGVDKCSAVVVTRLEHSEPGWEGSFRIVRPLSTFAVLAARTGRIRVNWETESWTS